MYAIGRAAALLGVCIKTLRRWDAQKKIICTRTVGGHRRFSRREIERLLLQRGAHPTEEGKTPTDNSAIYARVSSHTQRKRGDLDRQIQSLQTYAHDHDLNVSTIYKDVGSGLNPNRKGLWRLLNDAKKGMFRMVLINFKDRLTRFGYKYLEHYFAEFGVLLLSINRLDDKAPESELIEDLVAIVHSFSGKLYRMRRTEKEKE